MTLVPAGVSEVILAAELDKAGPWLTRHRWQPQLGEDGLSVDIHMSHPADEGPLLLRGEFDGYRAIPPLWTFLDPQTGVATPRAWPAGGPVAAQASILHSYGVICAHFSRSGYAALGGPHPWGGLTNWENVTEGVHAETLAEMLSVISTHLRYSPGRLG